MTNDIEDIINDFDNEISWIEHKLCTDKDEAIEMFRSLVFDTDEGITKYSEEYAEYCEGVFISRKNAAEEYQYQAQIDNQITKGAQR